MSSRTLTYFVSDVHLGLDFKDPAGREERFVSFLRSLDAQKTNALYMLGDIWDFWYEYRDVVPKGYVRVFAALMDLIDAGVKVYFFPGNHDIWCYGYFEEMGITVLQQPHLVEIGGTTFCLGHGDGLGPVGAGYRIMNAVFKSRLAQRLFSTLHPWIAFRLGCGWSRSNRSGHERRPYVFGGESEPIYRWASDFSSRMHVDCFIFGHYHTHYDAVLPTGARMIILKDWLDESSYSYFDGMNVCFGISMNTEK